MTRTIDRRAFLKRSGAAALGVMAAPLLASSRATAAGDRLVVAVGQWGIETPFAWRTRRSAYRPGLAAEWKPSNEMRTWTFTLRPGVAFHESWGECTAEDVKFTVGQNLEPDAQGGTAPYIRANLDRIETPDKLTVVMPFKGRLWDVPAQCSQFVGYQNVTSKKYLESVGEDKAAAHPIGTGPYRLVEGKQGDFHRFDPERRAKLTHEMGQKLYDGYYGVMLGMKSTTWAVSKRVGSWQTLACTPMETNYEYVLTTG